MPQLETVTYAFDEGLDNWLLEVEIVLDDCFIRSNKDPETFYLLCSESFRIPDKELFLKTHWTKRANNDLHN